MYEISDSYLSLMNSILQARLSDKSKANQIASYGIDGTLWPECEAKKIMLKLNSLSKIGYEGARATVYAEDLDYVSILRNTAKRLSLEKDALVEAIRAENTKYWSNVIAQRLYDNPLELDSLIRIYQSNTFTGVKRTNLKDLILHTVADNERKLKSGTAKIVIPTFEKLSDLIQGFNPRCLTMLTAATGVGKTNFCVSLAQKATQVMPVLFFNMEMDETDFAARFIHNACNIANKSWRDGSYVNMGTLNAIESFRDKKSTEFDLEITDGKALSKRQIEGEIYRMFDGSQAGLVIIDYDQKILHESKEDEWKALLDVFTALEEVSKRTNTHIIIAAQADDNGRAKASKRMEQPCTNVLNFYREPNGIDPSLDKFFIKALKTRFGSLGKLEMGADLAKSQVWEKDYVKFHNGLEKPKGKYEF